MPDKRTGAGLRMGKDRRQKYQSCSWSRSVGNASTAPECLRPAMKLARHVHRSRRIRIDNEKRSRHSRPPPTGEETPRLAEHQLPAPKKSEHTARAEAEL